MLMRCCPLFCFSILLVAAGARAERPIEERSKAYLVFVGSVGKIGRQQEKFGPDGTLTQYTASVRVRKVEHGKSVRPGQVVTVTWFQVTKRPSKPFAAAYGHRYPLKTREAARFWLMD